MTIVEFKLNPHPLETTLGGISWLKALRLSDDLEDVAVVENQQSIQREQRAARVGVIDDYRLYFLTSRARVRLTQWDTKIGPAYLVNYKNSEGEACCSMCLTVDVPRGCQPKQVKATLIVTPELEAVLRAAGGFSGSFVGITLPPEAGFANALTFIFKNEAGNDCGISMNITPALTRFIKIDNQEKSNDFWGHLQYNIHYIGQTANSLEVRLHAHEKIRMLADRLLTKELDQEPVVFAYTFSGGETLDSTLALDLIEAALITHFKPVLNIEQRNFPAGKSPKEINLRSRLRQEKITQVNVAPIGFLNQSSPHSLSLANGYGFTRDDSGEIRAMSTASISINLN